MIRLAAPPSKSVTHRAYVLAAQSGDPCTVARPLRAGHTDGTLRALAQMGARFEASPDGAAVRFLPAPLRPPAGALQCGNAATTMRFLAALAARLPVPTLLAGDAAARPQAALAAALRALGAHADGRPLRVCGPTRGGTVAIPPGTSSQVASALLLALAPSRVVAHAPVASRPYLDVTVECMAAFGVAVRVEASPAAWTAELPGGQAPRCARFEVEGDWSAAATLLCAAAIHGTPLEVAGLRADSAQGDRAILDLLAGFGCKVQGTAVVPAALESPGLIDVSQVPDLFPPLAAVAAHARGTTTFTGGEALRAKESDRIAAMADGLRAMGVEVQERPDGLVVHGTAGRVAPKAARAASRGDHRIHMSLAIAGAQPDGDAAQSFPGFPQALAALRQVAA